MEFWRVLFTVLKCGVIITMPRKIYLLLLLLFSLTLISCTDQRTLIIPSATTGDLTKHVKVTTTTVTDTTDETEVYMGNLEANYLSEGEIIKVLAYGTVSTASAVDSVTIRFKINNVTKQTFIMTPKVVTNADFHLLGVATQRTLGVTGSRANHQDICIEDICNSNSGVGVYDTTIQNNLSITAQWNNAKVGNVFNLYQGFMEYKKNEI